MARPHAVEAVISDFDGTLYHLALDLAAWRESVVAALVRAGRVVPEPPTVQNLLGALPAATVGLALDTLTRSECAAVACGTPAEGATSFLHRLRATHKVAVVSRNSAAAVREGLSKLGAPPSIVVVGRGDAEAEKPSPSPIHLAMSLLGTTAQKTLVLGDSSHDVEAAHAAGCSVVVVANDRLPDPPGNADHYVDRLEDVLLLIESGPNT
jgi:HAD superfamily hydrolase (TIGR01509 family)